MKTTLTSLLKWASIFAFVVVFGKPIMHALSSLLEAVSAKLP